MQALAERLDRAVAHAVVANIEPLQFSALKTVRPEPRSLVGCRCQGIDRRGKYLVFSFRPDDDRPDDDRPDDDLPDDDLPDDGSPKADRLLVHLSQGGRVDLEDPAKSTRPRNGVVRITVASDLGTTGILIKEFGHERKAAWWVLGPGDEGPLAGLGPEIDSLEAAEFLRSSDDTRRVHTILRDQRTLAGLGRGYTNDVLHRASLSPYHSLASLDADQRERLIAAIASLLDIGLAHERERKGGLPAKVGDHWIVHHRKGEPCPTCGDTLRWVSYESYEVTYCPACQTDGKVLADRRMSRLLR